MDLAETLGAEVRRRRDEVVSLAQELIRIPTVNPPGEGYRDVCDLVAARLTRQGFAAEHVRGEGAPGDSDRYPRWNLVARREGAGPPPEAAPVGAHPEHRALRAGRLQDAHHLVAGQALPVVDHAELLVLEAGQPAAVGADPEGGRTSRA